MEEIRPHFPHVAGVLHIPNIHAVIFVDAGQPVVAGIKGQGNGVWVGGTWPSSEDPKRQKKIFILMTNKWSENIRA